MSRYCRYGLAAGFAIITAIALLTPLHAAENTGGIVIETSEAQSAQWANRRYDPQSVWAYFPIQRYPVPWHAVEGNGAAAGGNAIDAFIQRKLDEAGLDPAPPAGKRTLLRRATYDLIGLPPTPEQVAAFLADDSPRAFEKVVDRLLASPRYGEQAARHWLDVTRYADTGGFSNDYERPNAWRYRDYVIRSFNKDKPFDRFIVEQLAGDELPVQGAESLIATGFLRMGPWEHTGMSVAAETRQQYLDDVTNSVGVTFLAQGLGCAKCHDHKFDPVPTRDYYRMQAVFAPVQFAAREVPFQPWVNTTGFEERAALTETRLEGARDFVRSLREKNKKAIAAHIEERGVERFDDLPVEQRGNKRHFGLSEIEKSLEKIHRKRIDYHERELRRYEPRAFSVYSGPPRVHHSGRAPFKLPPEKKRGGDAQAVHILQGGSLEAPAGEVSPGVLSAVARLGDTADTSAASIIPDSMHGRRLALARWIASPDNPLTARVIVNRIWQQHFTTGIVGTPNNFGVMGERPTHPELLDHLALWFIEHGWSIKKLHRLIMTSDAYQRGGGHPDTPRVHRIDPDNDLLAYYPPRRLAAEEIRDSLLAVTGELNTAMGGPGVFPKINWEAALQPRHIMGSIAPAYQPSPSPEQRNRRTIYTFRYRTLPNPMLEVFDRPSGNTSCQRRNQTIITPQAFALFNSRSAHDRALAFADRLMRFSDDPADRVGRAFRLIYGRPPTAAQRARCLGHVEHMTEHHRRHEPTVIEPPTTVERSMVEELTGETFTFEEELDVMAEAYQPDLRPTDVGPRTRALAELCLVLMNSNEFLYVY